MFQSCCIKLYGYLKVAPYQPEQLLDEDEDDYTADNGVRVMGIAYEQDR